MEEILYDDDDLDTMQQELEDRLSSVVYEIRNPDAMMHGDSDTSDRNAGQTEIVEEKSPEPRLPPPDLSKEVRGKDIIFPPSGNSKYAKFVERYVRPVTNADLKFLKKMRKKYEYVPSLTNKKKAPSKRAKRQPSPQSVPSVEKDEPIETNSGKRKSKRKSSKKCKSDATSLPVIDKQKSSKNCKNDATSPTVIDKQKSSKKCKNNATSPPEIDEQKSSKKCKNDATSPPEIVRRRSSRRSGKNQIDNVQSVPSVSMEVECEENIETSPAERKNKRKSSKKKKSKETSPPVEDKHTPKGRKKNDRSAKRDDPNVPANVESCDEYVVSTSQRNYDGKLSKKSSKHDEILPTLIIRKVKKTKSRKKGRQHSHSPPGYLPLTSAEHTEKVETSSSRRMSDLVQKMEELGADEPPTELDTDESSVRKADSAIEPHEGDEEKEAGTSHSPNHESNDNHAAEEADERSKIEAELKEKIARSKELSKFITGKLDALKKIVARDVKRNALMKKVKRVEVQIIDLHLIYKHTKSSSDRKRLLELIDQRDALLSQVNEIE